MADWVVPPPEVLTVTDWVKPAWLLIAPLAELARVVAVTSVLTAHRNPALSVRPFELRVCGSNVRHRDAGGTRS